MVPLDQALTVVVNHVGEVVDKDFTDTVALAIKASNTLVTLSRMALNFDGSLSRLTVSSQGHLSTTPLSAGPCP